MIRIERGPEPIELPPARARGLARAVLARRRGDQLVTDGYNLPALRDGLYHAQRAKCLYCERQLGKAGSPIEHFRPKGGADRGDPLAGEHAIDADHYWWLAWSWNNLVLACPTCNSASFKANRFPLEPGSSVLPVPDGLVYDDNPCFAVGNERPLLLDPTLDDPLDHITWRPLDPTAPDGPWRAFHRTLRGRITIHVLGLDGRNVDRAEDHVRHQVKPWVDRVSFALANGSDARTIWREALDHLFAPCQPYHAITHDALDFFLPADVRARTGLALPRPGAGPHDPRMKPAFVPLTSHADLTEEIILQLLGRELSSAELIAYICRARPSTAEELATMLAVGVPTVLEHCRRLVGDGRLTLEASGRYAAPVASPAL